MRNGDCQDVEELCFVQYFEVLSDKKMKVEKLVIKFGCFRVRLHRTSGEPRKFSARKKYGLVLFGAV